MKYGKNDIAWGTHTTVNYWVYFWVVVLSLITATAALGLLSLSFLFPDAEMFDVGTAERLVIALVGTSALGIVVLFSATFEVETTDPGRQT